MTRPVLNVGGRQLVLSAKGELGPRDRAAVDRLFADGAVLDRRCRVAMTEDAKNAEGPTQLYVGHHLSGLSAVAARFGVNAGTAVPAAVVMKFLDELFIRAIWATPESQTSFLHVDYTIDERQTDYVLSVAMGRNGEIVSVDMES